MGYVGAQRLLSHSYQASYDQLAAWLQDYNDHPDAPAIYKLALIRRPKGAGDLTPASFVGIAQPSPDLRRGPHRHRRRCRPRGRAARAPAADGRGRRLQRRLRAARREGHGRAARRARGRAVARPHPHPRARGRFAARRAGAGRCHRAARRQLGGRHLGVPGRQHARGRAPLRAGGRCAARPGVVVDAGRRRLLGRAHQPAGRQSAEVRALSQACRPAWPDVPRPDRAEDARHADRAQSRHAADRSPPLRHAEERPRRPPRAGAVPARRRDRRATRAVRRLARRRSASTSNRSWRWR